MKLTIAVCGPLPNWERGRLKAGGEGTLQSDSKVGIAPA